MALSEIKTNVKRQETKDEPQTNGSYKIRQIMIKIMEYTHIPMRKVKTVQQNEVQQTGQANKGNQKLYLPVKKKTKSQTRKQN